ncbi:hypothetical protein LXL04_017499 [Taraxacum kok-saghyz]
MTYAGKYRKMKKHMIVVRSGVGDDGGTGDDGEIRRWWWWVSSVMVEGGSARKRYNDSGGRRQSERESGHGDSSNENISYCENRQQAIHQIRLQEVLMARNRLQEMELKPADADFRENRFEG